MHPDLQHLIQLQDLDLAADRARRRIAELPAAQHALEARVAEKTAAVTQIKERIAAAQAASVATAITANRRLALFMRVNLSGGQDGHVGAQS